MPSKTKGINAERELIHLFWQTKNWAACRIAGSGSSQYPSADILASNINRKLAIEAKITKDKAKYFNKEEINQLEEFSKRFGAEPWIAVKFKTQNWLFLSLEDLKKSGKNFVISTELAKIKGLNFEELIKEL